MRTTCAQCELARDPATYDAGDESIDISITLSHYPSVTVNSTSPASSRPPVPPGTALQGQIVIDGAAPAGSFTFEALDVDPHSHIPGTMMSFLNLGPVPLVLLSHLPALYFVCTFRQDLRASKPTARGSEGGTRGVLARDGDGRGRKRETRRKARTQMVPSTHSASERWIGRSRSVCECDRDKRSTLHARTLTHTHKRTHTQLHAHKHTHTHTHTHTHIHTHTSSAHTRHGRRAARVQGRSGGKGPSTTNRHRHFLLCQTTRRGCGHCDHIICFIISDRVLSHNISIIIIIKY